MLCAYSKFWLKDLSVIENIVQDLMLWLWENRGNLNISSSLSSYMFTAVRNRCLKQLAHERVERNVLEQIGGRLADRIDAPDFYAARELEGKIAEAVSRLPEEWRTVFSMNRFQRMTYDEIAAALGISPKTVDWRICQSLKMLRKYLKDFLPPDSGKKGHR